MASGGGKEGSNTTLYLAWMYECFCDDGSGQDYQIKRCSTSIQHGEIFNWLTNIAEHTDPSVQIVIGIAPVVAW